MSGQPETANLTILGIAGPAVEPLALQRLHGSLTVGRSARCDWVLPDESVSRVHAQLVHATGHWYLIDLASRLGTLLNGVRLEANRASPIRPGDVIRIGPWALQVTGSTAEPDTRPTVEDRAVDFQPRAVPGASRFASEHLRLILNCATALHAANDERELARRLLDAALGGSGFARGAVVRPINQRGDVEVLAAASRAGQPAPEITFSRSLLRAAASGTMVWVDSRSCGNQQHGESIVRLEIHSAACAPIMLGQSCAAYLYLDARGSEQAGGPESAVLCEAIAHLGGLALAGIKRAELERRQAQFEEDLALARSAQELMLPAQQADVSSFRYAYRMKPGLLLAGDLFDVVTLSGGRVAVVLGDATGKGVGAAMSMAAAQSFLRAALQSHSLAEALTATNRFISARSTNGRFVSLWAGVFDPRSDTVEFVDAGHGLWLIREAAGTIRRSRQEGSLLLGIDSEAAFHPCVERLAPGERVILFSDGAVEQKGAGADMFGIDRLAAVLNPCSGAQADVESVFTALNAHAGGWSFTDDTTVASIERLSKT